MKILMNKTVQNVIVAVKSYRKWLYAEDVATGKWNEKKDYDQAAFSYYLNLWDKIPNQKSVQNGGKYSFDCGLDTSRSCFKAILSYPIELTFGYDEKSLGLFFFKHQGGEDVND